MTPLPALIVDSLACHRLTRLITADTITQPLRDRALEAIWRRAGRWGEVERVQQAVGIDPGTEPGMTPDGFSWGPRTPLPEGWLQQAMETEALVDPPKLATLITCRWCTSAYVAAFVTAMRALNPRVWRWASRALACASAAALWAAVEDR